MTVKMTMGGDWGTSPRELQSLSVLVSLKLSRPSVSGRCGHRPLMQLSREAIDKAPEMGYSKDTKGLPVGRFPPSTTKRSNCELGSLI